MKIRQIQLIVISAFCIMIQTAYAQQTQMTTNITIENFVDKWKFEYIKNPKEMPRQVCMAIQLI